MEPVNSLSSSETSLICFHISPVTSNWHFLSEGVDHIIPLEVNIIIYLFYYLYISMQQVKLHFDGLKINIQTLLLPISFLRNKRNLSLLVSLILLILQLSAMPLSPEEIYTNYEQNGKTLYTKLQLQIYSVQYTAGAR